MHLQFCAPRPDLSQFLRSYYLFDTPAPLLQPMSAELGNVRFVLRGGGRFLFQNGRIVPAMPANLVGPTMSAYALDAEGGTRVFGIGILPRGWAMLFGVDAAELADNVVDLTALAGHIARDAVEELKAASGAAEMAAAADRFFALLLTVRMQRFARAYPEAIERWLVDAGDPSLDRLIEQMDVSRRQTDRLAKQFFGASPKVLQRKYRILRAADRILFDGARRWTDMAGESFYDQSHFIREFRTFIGSTPAEFAAHLEALAARAKRERREEIAAGRSAGL